MSESSKGGVASGMPSRMGQFWETSGSVASPVIAGMPTSICNENFEGQLIFLVHDTPPKLMKGQKLSDVPPFWEAIIQGRFKHEFDNFFMGLEINLPLKLSLVARGVAMSLVRFVKSVEADLHTSSGDKNNSELPHMVTRHFKGVDYLIITPDGETPPPLGKSLIGSEK